MGGKNSGNLAGPNMSAEQLAAWQEGVCSEVLQGVSPHIASVQFGVGERTFHRWRGLAEREIEPYYSMFLEIWRAEALYKGEVQKGMGLGEKFRPGACWILERRDPENFSLSPHFRKSDSVAEDKPDSLLDRLKDIRERFDESRLAKPGKGLTGHAKPSTNDQNAEAIKQRGAPIKKAAQEHLDALAKEAAVHGSYAEGLRKRLGKKTKKKKKGGSK